jgi:GMP synthase (glutamine-hydrolysing)
MSVKSAIWVKAHLRRCNASGLPAVLVKRGGEEAGSIYVKINRLDGRIILLGPPPGPAYDERGDRRWSRLISEEPVPESEADRYLQRVRAIDPDIWIIEIEDAESLGLLELDSSA